METGKSVLQFQVESVLSRHTSPLLDRFRARYYLYRYYCCTATRGTNPLFGSKAASILSRHRSCESFFWMGTPQSGNPFFFSTTHACCLYISRVVEGAQKHHTPSLHAVLGFVDCRALATAFGMGTGEREPTHHQPSHVCGYGCNHTPACRARPALARLASTSPAVASTITTDSLPGGCHLTHQNAIGQRPVGEFGTQKARQASRVDA